jgi:hypothetical protein
MAEVAEMLSVAQVAALARVSAKTVHRWARAGLLIPAITPPTNRGVLFDASYVRGVLLRGGVGPLAGTALAAPPRRYGKVLDR